MQLRSRQITQRTMAAEKFNPPVYSGDDRQSISTWLTVFNKLAETNGWDDVKKVAVLPHFVSGSALAWYAATTQRATPPAAWRDWEGELRVKFTPPESMCHAQLEQRMLAPGETFETYITAVLNSCQLVDPNMSNALKVHHLIKGLPPALRKDMTLSQPEDPDKFRSVILQLGIAATNPVVCAT